MRRIVALMALVISAWYLTKRWRWIWMWLQGRLPAMMLSVLRAGARAAPAMLGEMAVAARAKGQDVRSRATATASTMMSMTRSGSAVAERTAEEVTSAAAQGTAGAAANLQEAPGTVADQAEQAAKLATGVVPAPSAIPAVPSSIHTDVATPPSVHETAQAGLVTMDAKVRDLSALAAPEPTEQGAVRSEESATSGALGGDAMAAERVTDASDTREDEAAEAGIAPEEQRPGSVAGAGMTTPVGGPVRPLSPVGGEPTSTGAPEPLPPERFPGEPGIGGPAGSSQAPSRPGSTATPTTGMEHPPVVDRMAEVAQRTSGHVIGNKTTRVYHAATSANLPAERNRIYFETQEEAIAAGFEPAENERLDSAGS